MKKGLYLGGVLALAALWLGCTKTEPAASSSAPKSGELASKSTEVTPPATDGAATAVTLVRLKVPNMT